jgi:predicted patatin/cPLA2 family phospholipase
MNSLRHRPKGDFIWKAEWGQLYILAERWKSDLQFYKADLKFLYYLMNKYFIWLIKEDNIEEVKEKIEKLRELYNKATELMEKVQKHMSHLSALNEDPF